MDSELYQYFFATEFVDMFPQTNGDILLQSTLVWIGYRKLTSIWMYRATLTAPSEQVFSHIPQGKSFFCDEVTLIKSGVHSASDFSLLEYRQISVKSLLFCVQNQDCSEKKSRESPDPPVISRRFREIWKFVPPQSYRARLNKQKG